MEHLFLEVSHSKEFVADKIKMLAIDKEFIEEMGEPVKWGKDQTWLFCFQYNYMIGFIAYNSTTILYAYTKPNYRGKGVFNFLYSHLPFQKWITVASNLSLPIFLSKGFVIKKSFKTCHKLIKP